MSEALADAFSGVKPVEARHRFDEAALDRWMQANVDGYAGPLTVHQFKGGQSNPTYRLETPGRAYVLRRKPFGPLLPSAHAVEREFRLIAALNRVNFAGASRLCALRGPGCHRRDLLRDGGSGGRDPLGRRPARPDARRPTQDL